TENRDTARHPKALIRTTEGDPYQRSRNPIGVLETAGPEIGYARPARSSQARPGSGGCAEQWRHDNPDHSGVTVMTALVTWSDKQLDLIRRTVAKEATPDEFRHFIHIAQHTGLDPL